MVKLEGEQEQKLETCFSKIVSSIFECKACDGETFFILF